MMIREWRCSKCATDFESEEPLCPNCHTEDGVTRVFLTPPAVHTSGKRQFTDKMMREIADDYGFTDMGNTHTGSVAGDAKRRKAHVVGDAVAPSGVQSLIDQKLDQMVSRYKPPVNVTAPKEPTPLKQGPLGNDQLTAVTAPKLRPGPGTLTHPDDRK